MAKKKSKKKLYITISIILTLLIGGIIMGLLNKDDGEISVVTSKVQKRTIIQSVSAVGKIEPETEVKISSEASGEIVFLGVKEGDTVRGGAVLVRIKPDIIETQLEQYKSAAEATNLEIDVMKTEKDRAAQELKRISELYQKEFSSKQELEMAKANFDKSVSNYQASLSRYQQSLSALKQIQKSADRTTVYSPINGVVTKLDIEKGEKVVGTSQFQGTEMMRVSDLNIMNALVDVDENDIVLVKIGDTTRIQVDAIRDVVFKAIVLEIGHSAQVNQLGTQDQITNFKVKIRFIDQDGRLRPGMSCNVDIETNRRENVLSIPLTSVTVRETKTETNVKEERIQKKEDEKEKIRVKRPPSVVFMKNGLTAKMVEVKTGISDKGFIEILEGLKEGDEIISGNFMAVSKLLKDGSKIKFDVVSKKKSEKK